MKNEYVGTPQYDEEKHDTGAEAKDYTVDIRDVEDEKRS
jgi:hypothetical protein